MEGNTFDQRGMTFDANVKALGSGLRSSDVLRKDPLKIDSARCQALPFRAEAHFPICCCTCLPSESQHLDEIYHCCSPSWPGDSSKRLSSWRIDRLLLASFRENSWEVQGQGDLD